MTDGIGGPFLAAAFLCERVLQEKDGVLSAIRIIDRFIHTVTGPEIPEKMPPLKVQFSILIGFKSGDAKGKRELKIRPKTPSGKELPVVSFPILFEGGEKGSNVNIRYAFETQEEGLYWFDVELNDKLFTRMPLSVIYQKTPTPAQSLH